MSSQRQQRDSSSASRIRDNQRRSRARHREFVDELKARLDEYDRRGVQATLDMRRAARAVALENSRLRSLLASRGITSEDIEMYLASFNNHVSGDSAVIAPTAQTDELPPVSSDPEPFHRSLVQRDTNGEASCSLQTVNTNCTIQKETHMGRERLTDDSEGDWSPSSNALDKLSFLAHISAQQSCCGPATHCSAADDRDIRRDIPGTGLRAEASHSPRSLPLAMSATASHLEMSCTAAAHIMANMDRNRDEELAREALGCSGQEECFVSNITLFQLLDGSEAV